MDRSQIAVKIHILHYCKHILLEPIKLDKNTFCYLICIMLPCCLLFILSLLCSATQVLVLGKLVCLSDDYASEPLSTETWGDHQP